MNIRYLVKIANNPANIFYEFHAETKIILGIKVEAEHIEIHQVKWLMSNAPRTEQELLKEFPAKVGKKVSITYVPEMVTFDDFWNRFNHKVGNKPRAKKLWALLSDVDRLAAYSYIESYNAHLRSNPTLSKLYPETYLSQERWKI